MLEEDVSKARWLFGGLLLIALGAGGVLGRQVWQRKRSTGQYVLGDTP